MPPKVEAAPEGGAAGGDTKTKGGGFCCCKKKVDADDAPFQAKALFWEQKKCHDTPCILLFIAYWVGMILILIVSLSNRSSPVESLIYGTDFNGYTCGANNEKPTVKDLSTKKYLHFPLEGQDIESLQSADPQFYGICVDSCPGSIGEGWMYDGEPYSCDCLSNSKFSSTLGCPDVPRTRETPGDTLASVRAAPTQAADPLTSKKASTHDCICEYGGTAEAPDSFDGRKCWDRSYPTKSILYRCIPCEDPTRDDCTPVSYTTTRCRNRDSELVKTLDKFDRDCTKDADAVKPWRYGQIVASNTVSVYPDLYPDGNAAAQVAASVNSRTVCSLAVKAGEFVVGGKYTIASSSDGNGGATTNFATVGAALEAVGTEFVATGAGSGTGTATFVIKSTGMPIVAAACDLDTNYAGTKAACEATRACNPVGPTTAATCTASSSGTGVWTAGAFTYGSCFQKASGTDFWVYEPVRKLSYWSTFKKQATADCVGSWKQSTVSTVATCPHIYSVSATVAKAGKEFKYILQQGDELVGTTDTTGPVADAIGDSTSGIMKLVMSVVNDIYTAKWIIIVVGAPIAFVATVFWIMLLKYCVKPLVWLTILIVFALLVGSTLMAFYKGGMFTATECLIDRGEYLSAENLGATTTECCATLQAAYDASATDPKTLPSIEVDCSAAEQGIQIEGSEEVAASVGVSPATDETERTLWQVLGFISGILALIYLIVICMNIKKIKMATSIIKEASNAIKAMPLMLFFPFGPLVVVMIALLYYLLGAAFILTADSVSYADLATQVSETAQIQVSNTTSFVNTGDSSENIQFYLFWYHTLGWLWTHQLVMAVTMTSIAGGVSFWYFAGDDRNSNPKVKFAFFRAFGRIFRYHLGSMLFGALIIAIVQLMRMILAYIDKQTKTWQDKNKLLKIAFKVVACILWCFEKIIKFLTRRAYIMIAINGTPFCRSAKTAFKAMWNNMFLVGFVEMVSKVLIMLGKLAISIGGGVLTYYYIASSMGGFTTDEYVAATDDTKKLLSSEIVPAAIAFLLCFATSSIFFYSYQMAIDTITLCFIKEKDEIDAAVGAGRQVKHVGPDSLINFMKQNQARLQKAADAQAEAHGEAPAAAGKGTEVDDGTKAEP